MGRLANGNYRLTITNRDSLAQKILAHKYGNTKFTELEQQTASLALAIYNDCFTDADQEKMNAIPKGWLPLADQIRVSYDHGTQVVLNFNGSVRDLVPYRTSRIIGSKAFSSLKGVFRLSTFDKISTSYRSSEINHAVTDPELTKRIIAHVKQFSDLSTEVASLNSNIRATLNSVTTTNRLKEVWPEAKPFIIDMFGDGTKAKPPSTAITLPIADINQKLGLPIP